MGRGRHGYIKGIRTLQKATGFLLLFSFTLSGLFPAGVSAQSSEDSGLPAPTEQSVETPSTMEVSETPLPEVTESTEPEVSEDTDPPAETEVEETPDTEAEESVEEEPEEEPVEELPESLMSQSGTDPASGNLVNSSENKSGQEVNNITGSFTYTFPISVPPGRGTMFPDLSLEYNSQNSSISNIAGYGWDTNIPYIQRVNQEGTEDLYSKEYFASSFSGDLATTSTANIYAAKVTEGDFLSYEYVGDKWIVTDKSGIRYTFGSSTASRLDDPSNSAHVYKWMIEEVRDEGWTCGVREPDRADDAGGRDRGVG